MTGAPRRTFGAEEELLLIDPATGAAAPVVAEVLRLAGNGSRNGKSGVVLAHELKQEQIEGVTGVHTTLAGLAGEIREGRALADGLAQQIGMRAAALGTPPLASASHTVPAARCEALRSRFALTAA
ncbi:carboxylate--amine ligase, partial [Arthrobacter deserti]|nr:carboxylate--amine ligase [Arthrobacter deserti]